MALIEQFSELQNAVAVWGLRARDRGLEAMSPNDCPICAYYIYGGWNYEKEQWWMECVVRMIQRKKNKESI